MKPLSKIVIFLLLISALFVQSPAQFANKPQSFVIANDWRFKTTGIYYSDKYLMGVLKAIDKAGKGDFMISCGDVSPVDASRELISEILGKDYLWYTAPGNHDQEDTTYMRLFRNMNPDGGTLPHIVRKGPKGCEETTYAIEIGDCHIAFLNIYFDGKSDIGTDGDIIPELLEWLEEDLKNNRKPFTFVVAHEPIIAIPDMDNGRIRHQGDSLDKYYRNALRFQKILKKYSVTAYLNGHTHCTSITKINGVWQIDAGHAYGVDDPYPEFLFEELSECVAKGSTSGKSAEQMIADYFYQDSYSVKKVLFYTNLTEGVSYKKIADEPALKLTIRFYNDFKGNLQLRQKYIDTFNQNLDVNQSTFLKIFLEKPAVKIEVYRNDSKGGPYRLMHTEFLK
ncbi:MAG: metallophosphoesterase [Candidatus Marinimicrobia bacterium]|nr:metallophosphoesterase [Candidatus Neomarinimicrobiota bacterium]